jgi:predicted polyphosphate/ATP-dependent NAD kinase
LTDHAALVGIIANPVSARDIRRVTANASNLQTTDRVNIVLRLLSTFATLDVSRVMMMPDRAGIQALLTRHLERGRRGDFAQVEFLDFEPTSTVEDTFRAARMLRDAGASAIVVLGGDGTHRAVARECGDVPIAGLSSGTNNAFPEMRESTVAAMAVALYTTGRLSRAQALAPNKLLEVSINEGERRDIAIVDAVISHQHVIGARAIWRTDSLSAIYLTYADPQAIGLSAIGALLQPVGRSDPGGLAVRLAGDAGDRRLTLRAPIAPGMVRDVGIVDWEPMLADRAYEVAHTGGIVALDGERELAFGRGDRVSVTLREKAFLTVDIGRCMQLAAAHGLFRHSTTSP